MTDDPFPEVIPMNGVNFGIKAIKRGRDRDGIMRYRMLFDHGAPVAISKTQMYRGMMALVFDTPNGRVAFDFSFEERE